MQKTQHYELNKPDITDPLRVADLNENSDLLDAAIKAVADTAANKAEAQDVTALNQTVAALTTALGSGGQNCRIAWGSYTGTGKTYNSLNFDFCPVLILTGSSVNATSNCWPTIFMRGVTVSHPEMGSETINVTWTDTGVSWSGGTDSANSPGYFQNNISGRIYYYCVIGYTAP